MVGPTTFVDKDHVAVKKLLVDDGGVWRDCTVFQNKASRGFVIWFGGEEYEGLGGTYKFDDGVLKDDDGVVMKSRESGHVNLLPVICGCCVWRVPRWVGYDQV